jgi:hypothetical protein
LTGGGGGPANGIDETSSGGLGGGGDGKLGAGDPGTDGLGGGGGGMATPRTGNGGDGGSGTVIVRYFGSQKASGGTVTTSPESCGGPTVFKKEC